MVKCCERDLEVGRLWEGQEVLAGRRQYLSPATVLSASGGDSIGCPQGFFYL